jgi:RimJ/RimL family protein N-acetyltransferase
VGWLSWYWVLRGEDASELRGSSGSAILIGSGGFKGPPQDGEVEIGFQVRKVQRRRGYAAEALRALVTWAVSHPDVRSVIAETAENNVASIGLLEKLGFARVGDGSRSGLIRFVTRGLPS